MNLGVAFAPLVPDYVVWAAFGVAGHVRISYATDDVSLQAACARIVEFCAGLR